MEKCDVRILNKIKWNSFEKKNKNKIKQSHLTYNNLAVW